ncbi:MAG TPA: CoA transferase [Polyangiaceae bacterium]|nr:CoA transferase [Polyangiaceae bacterium]
MRPLDGVRVLDLTRLLPGPFGSLVLRDLGAQVDKIEDAGAGDYLRYMQPQKAGTSVAFAALNRGKRSAVVDLKNAEGRAAFERLVGHYDVLFEQFRPGVLDRLGLGHDTLRAKFPSLIICALPGYGQNGPLRARAGHDLNYLARAGILGLQGPTDGPPQVPGTQLADISGGLWSALAIVAALRRRDQTGQGAVLDISMTDGVVGFASIGMTAALAGSPPTRGDDVLTGGLAPYQTYFAKDGAPMTLASLEPKFWLAFAAATGLDPDPTALLPGEHQLALRERIAGVFATRTRSEWEAFAAEHDCCVEPVLKPEEVKGDAQLAARDVFFEQERAGETLTLFRTPVSDREEQPPPAPDKGADTRQVFLDAGFSSDEIDALLDSGALKDS